MYKYELEQIQLGRKNIAGTDEAGRGPLAGPIVVASVILPLNYENKLINDSKKLTEAQREKAYEIIVKDALAYSVEIISAKMVDELNPKAASRFGMIESTRKLSIKPDVVLSDFEKLDFEIPNIPITKGDSLSITIAAASIIAKVTRDRIMNELDKKYPGYDLASNKGYGTAKHRNAINKIGIVDIHRKSYEPIKSLLKK